MCECIQRIHVYKVYIFLIIMFIGLYVFLEILGKCCRYIMHPVYMYTKYICIQSIHIFDHHVYRFIRIS